MGQDELIIQTEKTFESIKHIDENGNEYWYARELMIALNYTKWGNFKGVIIKAMQACENSEISTFDCFAEVGKPIISGKGKKELIEDYKLTRYACYLIAQNGSPTKKQIALAQTYFAVKTRQQELTEEQYKQLPEDEKRLYNRVTVRNRNKYLFDTAKASGVRNYGKFNNAGYMGLYNGETAEAIAKRKGINSKKQDILDYMGSEELGANIFRITQTDALLKRNNVNNENDACYTHNRVGKAVRKAIEEVGGTMPEDLPTPKKSIKELQKEKEKQLQLSDKSKKKLK